MVSEQLISITYKLMFFFVPEALSWLLLLKAGKRFSFRFHRIEGHPNLRPFAKTRVVAIIIILITLFSQEIAELILGKTIREFLLSFGSNLWMWTLILTGFTFLWAYNYILEKRWDKISWVVLLIETVLLYLLFFR